MSSHAGTIYCTKHGTFGTDRLPACPYCRDGDSKRMDALAAENQRLREALDTTVEWAQEQGYDQLVERLEKASAGDGE